MAVVNRSLDASQQRYVLSNSYLLTVTGASVQFGMVPSQGTLEAVRVAAHGISGTPTGQLYVNRFIAGAGYTSIAGVATVMTAQAVGTSGIQSVVLAASGSSLLNLQAGDQLVWVTGGANSAVNGFSIAAVIKATQDIKTQFGV